MVLVERDEVQGEGSHLGIKSWKESPCVSQTVSDGEIREAGQRRRSKRSSGERFDDGGAVP
jgi:hypothetical protein